MVRLERVQRFAQGATDGRNVLQFLVGQLVQIFVARVARVDLVLDAVEACHQHGGETQVWVRGRIREADFHALGLRRGAERDPARCRTVARRVGEQHRCFKARNQTLVGVGRRVGEGVQCLGVLENTADVPQRFLGQACVLVAGEQRLTVFPDRLVTVHAGAVIALDRLGHEGCGLAVGRGDVVHHVLVELQLVGNPGQVVEGHAQLVLGGRHLVVVLVHVHAHGDQGRGHLGADVAGLVDRVDREVAALDARTVAHVAAFHFVAGGVRAFFGVELEERTVHFDREANIVEHEELGFRAEEHVGAHAAVLDELLGLLRSAAWVAGVELAGDRVLDVTEDDQLWLRGEGVHHRRVHVGHEQHVGLVDGFPARDRRAVEQDAFVECVFVHGVLAHGEVLQLAAGIGEAHVDVLNVVLFDHLSDISIGGHALSFLGRSGSL